MERIKPSYGNGVRPMEEKRMEKDLKKVALPDEGMEGAGGGGTVPDQFAGLNVAGLIKGSLTATTSAQAMPAQSTLEFFELELRKTGMNDKQSYIFRTRGAAKQAASRVFSVP